MQWLTVRAVGREFGLDAGRVRELMPCSEVTRVPGSARALRGLAGLRGQPVPVLDLALRLGGRPVAIESRTPLVILTALLDGEPIEIAFLVEGAGTLVEVADPLISRELDALAPGGICTGFAEVGDDLVPLLDVDALVAKDRLDEMVAKPRSSSVRGRAAPPSNGGVSQEAGAEKRRGEGGAADATPPERASGARKPAAFASPDRAVERPAAPVADLGKERRKQSARKAWAREPEVRVTAPCAAPLVSARRVTASESTWVREPALRAAPGEPARRGGLGWLGLATIVVLGLGLVTLLALAMAGPQDERRRTVASTAIIRMEPAVRTEPAKKAEVPAKKEAVVASGRRLATEAVPCETHEIRPGDTLWGIARRYLEDPFRWPEIQRRNRDMIKNPDVISPHLRLRITGSCGIGREALDLVPSPPQPRGRGPR